MTDAPKKTWRERLFAKAKEYADLSSDKDDFCAFTIGAAFGRADALKEAQVLVDGLDAIACWHAGKKVTGSFDEPGSAQMAREALDKWKEETGE